MPKWKKPKQQPVLDQSNTVDQIQNTVDQIVQYNTERIQDTINALGYQIFTSKQPILQRTLALKVNYVDWHHAHRLWTPSSDLNPTLPPLIAKQSWKTSETSSPTIKPPAHSANQLEPLCISGLDEPEAKFSNNNRIPESLTQMWNLN